MIELKVAGVAAVTYVTVAIAELADRPPGNGVLSAIILVGAAVGALVVIGRFLRSIFRFTGRVSDGVDLLFELAHWRHQVEGKLEDLRRDVSHRLDEVERKVEANAADLTVKHTIKTPPPGDTPGLPV